MVLSLILFLCSSPGCWNRQDPELLAIVLGTAFDFDAERELYQVIAQVANPLAMGDGGGGGGGPAFWTISAFGHTPYEAIRNLTLGTSRSMFWAHSRVILISETLARRGIGDILDLVERERQFRPTASPVVVQGDVHRLMVLEFPLEETGTRGIDRQIETIQFDASVFPLKLLNELYSTLEQPGMEIMIGKIEVLEEQEGEEQSDNGAGGAGGEQGGSSSQGDGAGKVPPTQAGGAAAFRGDRMVGWLNDMQMQGWAYATGRGNRFVFIIDCPDHEGSYLTIENFKAHSTMRPVGGGEEPRIEMAVRVEGRLQDFGCREDHDLVVEDEYTRRIERITAQAIRNRIEALIGRAQELNSDVLGFGNLIYRKQPRLWRKIEDRWDEIFPNLVVNVQVEYNLARTGLVTDPLGIQ